jgi:rod shape-determining protein MreC
MAAPRHRRRGFSRRVQYGLFAGYVIAVIGIMLGAGLLMLSRFDPRAFGTLRGVVVDAGAIFAGNVRMGKAVANHASGNQTVRLQAG